MDSTVMDLARFLFERQAQTFTDDPDYITETWESSSGVRDFWISEAEAILGFLMPADA